MKPFRIMGAVASAAALALLAAACSSSSSSGPASSTSSANLKFAYANLTESSGLFSLLQTDFMNSAHTAGVQLTTYNNN